MIRTNQTKKQEEMVLVLEHSADHTRLEVLNAENPDHHKQAAKEREREREANLPVLRQ